MRLFLGQADASDGRLGEGDAWDDSVVRPHRRVREHVGRGHPALVVSEVRVQERAAAPPGWSISTTATVCPPARNRLAAVVPAEPQPRIRASNWRSAFEEVPIYPRSCGAVSSGAPRSTQQEAVRRPRHGNQQGCETGMLGSRPGEQAKSCDQESSATDRAPAHPQAARSRH